MRRTLSSTFAMALAFAGGLAFAQLAVGQEAPVKPAHRIELADPLAAEKALDDKLELRGNFQAGEASLKSFAVALERSLDTNVLLAAKKLEEAAVDIDTPMTYGLRNVRVKIALKLILGEMGLSYVVEDNVLIITTPEDAGSKYVTRVYDCCDLLALPSLARHRSSPRGRSTEDLLELIMTMVQPDSWCEGNDCPVGNFKGLLIVSQTQEIHDDIEKFLNQLHKAAGIEGKVKVQK